MRKRLFLWLRILLALLVVLFLLTLAASTPKVQNYIAQRLITDLSARYGITLSVDAVRVNPLSLNATIQHIQIPDHKGDTLLYIRSLNGRWSSLSALIANASSTQYRLGETLLKLRTYDGDSLSNLELYLRQLPRGRNGRFEAKSIRAGALRVSYSDDENEDQHEMRFTEVAINDFLASKRLLKGAMSVKGAYFKNGALVEPTITASAAFDTANNSIEVRDLQIRTDSDAIEVSDLTVDRSLKQLQVTIAASFFSGKRLADYGINGFAATAFYVSGSLTADRTGVRTENLSVQWGESDAIVRGNVDLIDPIRPFTLEITSVDALWKDMKGLVLLGDKRPVVQPLLGSRAPIRGSLRVAGDSTQWKADAALTIEKSRVSASFSRVGKRESVQIDARGFNLGWVVNGANQRLTARLNARRNLGGRFAIDAQIHQLEFEQGFDLRAINVEASPVNTAYEVRVSSRTQGQSFETNFRLEKQKDRYSVEGKASIERWNALLTLTDFEALPFSTFADFSLWGSSLNDLQGQLDLNELRFFPTNRPVVNVGSVRVSHTALNREKRQLLIVSEAFINLEVSGNYHLFDWKKSLSQFRFPTEFELDADIQTGNRWVELIEGSTVLPELSGFVRYSKGLLKSDIRLSQFSYDVFDLKQLHAYTDESGGFMLEAQSLISPYFSLASVNTTIKGNRLEVRASTPGENADQFLFNSSWNRVSDDQLLIAIDPSRFTLKQYDWTIEKRAEFSIDIKNKRLELDRLDLKTVDNGFLSIYGGYNDNANYAINLELENAPIETITPALKNLSLKGSATGFLQFKKQAGRYDPQFNLSVEDLLINNKFVGFFNGVISGSANADIFTLQADVLNSGRASLELSGILNQTENGSFDLDVDARLAEFDITPFSALGSTTFSNLRGFASGSVSLVNTLEQPQLVGALVLNEAGLGFPYLGVDFNIDGTPEIRLNGTDFYFDHFKLVDTAFNTATEIDGFIYHQGLKKFSFDLKAKTLSNASLVLQTKQRPESLYYGTGFVSGSGSVTGTPENTVIQVVAETREGSSLFIPLNSETVDFSDDLMRFTNSVAIEESRAYAPIETKKGVSLDFNLRVTPSALVEVIVDPESGSRLRGRGTGQFRFQIAPTADFTILGEYTVASGAYDYRFGGIIDKGFVLAPGGMITWNGDPYDADINLEAVYSLNANPSPLLDSSSFPRPIQTDVLIQLGGKLLNPVIDFSLRFPTLNSVVRSEIEYRLQDRSALERNVFFLLAQGNFVNEQMGLSQQALTGNLLQSASGLLEEVLGASEVIDLGLSYEQGYRNPNANVAIEDRIGVTVSTQLGNRLIFNGKLGVPVGRVTETVVAGDVELQLLLNEEGTLSAKIFNRENTLSQFLASIPGYTQGLGLSYQVDFDDFKELIRRVLKSSISTE